MSDVNIFHLNGGQFFQTEHWIMLSGQDQAVCEERTRLKIEEIRSGAGRYSKTKNNQFLPKETAIADGFRGEIAASRYFDLLWYAEKSSDNNINGDLEFGVEVKATSNFNGNLYCSEKTRDDYLKRSPNTPIVLTLVDAWPFVEFHGWVFVKELSKFPFHKTHSMHNAGFLVPREKLRSILEFKELIAFWKNKRSS